MPTVVPVRFKFNPRTYWYTFPQPAPKRGDRLVIARDGGKIFGWAEDDPFEITEEQESSLKSPLLSIIRIATDEDLKRLEELEEKGAAAKEVFRELAKKRELDIKPIDVEYLMDTEKAIFHFSSEERVDFRELVRDLANRLRIHVDMKQIGVRDEARLIGGIGHCGEVLCCVKMSSAFQPVSIRMAKEQDLPLNPGKVSGACGRLMCCLRYEFEAYKDFKSRAPKANATVETPAGQAKVVELDTLRERVRIKMTEGGETFYVPLSGMVLDSDNEQQIRPNKVTEEAFCENCPQTMLRERSFEIPEDEILDVEASSKSKRRRKRSGKKKTDASGEQARSEQRRSSTDASQKSRSTDDKQRDAHYQEKSPEKGDQENSEQKTSRRRRSRRRGSSSQQQGQRSQTPQERQSRGEGQQPQQQRQRKQRPGQNSSNIRNPQNRQRSDASEHKGESRKGESQQGSGDSQKRSRSRRRRGSRGSSGSTSGQQPMGRAEK